MAGNAYGNPHCISPILTMPMMLITPSPPVPHIEPSGRATRLASRRAWAAAAAAALGALTMGISIAAMGPSLPLLQANLHTPLDQLGLLFAANFAGSVVATLVAGPFFDRRPAGPLMIAGLLLMMTGQVLLALATIFPLALIALLLTGLGLGTFNLGSAVLMARLFGRHGGRVLSLVSVAFGVGAFSGPLLVAVVVQTTHGYRALFIGIAVLLLLPLVLYAVLPLAGPSIAGPQAHKDPLPRSAAPAIALLAAVASLYLGAEIGFGGWAFTYVRQTTSVDISTASWLVSAFWLALGLGSLAAAVRPARLPDNWLILLSAAGATLSTLAVLGGRGYPGVEIAASFSLGLFLGPIYPLSLANAAGLVPAAAGRVSAIVISVSQGGAGILPWVQGLLFALGPIWGMGMTALICLLMTVLQLAYMRARAVHLTVPMPRPVPPT